MKTFVITKKYSNKRIDNVLKDKFKNLPHSLMYKAFRKKDIKVNGKRVTENTKVFEGDKVELYIIDEILENPNNDLSGFSIVYEDNNILIVNKQQGIAVHPNKDEQNNSLIDKVRIYLKEKDKNSEISLCHRLDRNTGGLVIIAKNKAVLDEMLNRIKNKEVKKFYKCIVKGKMPANSGELHAFLFKDDKKSMVYISDEKKKGYSKIITRYKVNSFITGVTESNYDFSELDIELITGKTHQIRAHLAFIGNPIVGDGKYGINTLNRMLGLKCQCLWAYKIEFDFIFEGILSYLNKNVFEVSPGYKKCY